MPSLETLTEADIRPLFGTSSLRKAKGYRNRVSDLIRTGNTLTTRASGSRRYQVEIEIDADGIYAQCSCPYDWGGYCKHIGAVLLVWVQAPNRFITKEAKAKGEKTPLEVVAVPPAPTQRPLELPV